MIKKELVYLLLLGFIIFIMPAILTKQRVNSLEETFVEENKIDPNGEEEKKEDIHYENVSTQKIKLLRVNENTVEELNINEYLYGVVAAEMPVDFHLEALKSQAVVARTYTLYKKNQNRHEEADICDQYTCCQAYITKEARFGRWEDNQDEKWQTIQNAVNSTTGEIITYDGEPIEAFFHSNSGGMTEIPVNVWGGRILSIFRNSCNIW